MVDIKAQTMDTKAADAKKEITALRAEVQEMWHE